MVYVEDTLSLYTQIYFQNNFPFKETNTLGLNCPTLEL